MNYIIAWILGGIAAYKLWGHSTWLFIIVIVLVLTLAIGTAKMERGPGVRLSVGGAWLTFMSILCIFLYSIFK